MLMMGVWMRGARGAGGWRGMVRNLAVLAVFSPVLLSLGGCDSLNSVFQSIQDGPDKINQTLGTAPAQDIQTGSDDDGTIIGRVQPGNDKRPQGRTAQQQNAVASGLVADQANAQYTEAELVRQGDPTRPLNADAAQAPYAPPAPTAVPVQPVRQSNLGGAPARAPSTTGATLADTYRARLAQQGGAVPADAGVASAGGAVAVGGGAGNGQFAGTVVQPITLASASVGMPRGIRALSSDNRRGVDSFEVAAVGFGGGSFSLSEQDRAQLRDAATLIKTKGGSVRVVGHIDAYSTIATVEGLASQQLAAERAAVVANTLIDMGVPAGRIYAGTDQEGGVALADAATSVFLVY